MGEHSFEKVTEALNASGLTDLMYPQYQVLLTCMAEMADAGGGREFSATHAQVAKRARGLRHGSLTPEIVAEFVFDFIKLGIVETVSTSGPVSYQTEIGKDDWKRISKDEQTIFRFGSFERFEILAEEIRSLQGNDDAPLFPSVVPKQGPLRILP